MDFRRFRICTQAQNNLMTDISKMHLINLKHELPKIKYSVFKIQVYSNSI